MQLVIAAMTTDPSDRSCPFSLLSGKFCEKLEGTSDKRTRSCGRFGPAMLGSTDDRSNSSSTEYFGLSLSEWKSRFATA